MSESNISKKKFLNLYNQLTYDYQCIVLNTFRCLVSYKGTPKRGYKPYNVAKLIKQHQKDLKYTDQDVCDKVNALIANDNIPYEPSLSKDTFYKIKRRNTQTSKEGINYLKYIAQALEFDYEDYKRKENLTQHPYELAAIHSYETNSIDTLYDLLSKKEKSAILQLTVSLLKLSVVPEYSTEYLDCENTDTSD